ncbi:MAG TPA: hypothetical protein VG326_18050 [Tepidisphaeraceae bacterium]|jgi:hypothetical protein|nr:hypothetical protein [Tepidisphaeraceae bacterium]
MPQSELLKKVVTVLESADVPYMLTGSYASSLQGEPRLTHDVDLVVAITPIGGQALLKAFRGPDYYLDEGAIAEAIARKSQFNLLDAIGGDKVDFWILTDETFDQSRFARRYVEEFEGLRLYVSRPEDTILMKLRWAEMSGGSERQFNDARGVFELQRASIDLDYMERWTRELRITELWERIKREAQSSETH